MTIFLEEMNVVVGGEDKSRLGKERDVEKVILLSNRGGPDVEGVDDQSVDGGVVEHHSTN